jgi:beta-1,4-mannosyltransferase
MKRQTATILVLGDLNRSPRMLNHSKAISEVMDEIDEVSLIGYKGSDLRSDIANDKKIKVYYIPDDYTRFFKKLPRIFFLFSAIIKIIVQVFYLIYTLMTIPKFNFLILQNPPGIPAIYICSIICFIRRGIFVLDWHNYGYTILQCNGRNRLICYIAKLYEKLYGHSSHINFCVSDAMKENLKDMFGIDAITLPDQAMRNVFKRLSIEESHSVLQKYEEYFIII